MNSDNLMGINWLSYRGKTVRFLIKGSGVELGQFYFIDVQTIEDWGIGVKFFRLRSGTIF